MRALLVVLTAVGLLQGCKTAEQAVAPNKQAVASSKRTFQAPTYEPGTRFVFRETRLYHEPGRLVLNYKGKTADGGYDFGEGKIWRYVNRIRFPLTTGQTWEYSEVVDLDIHKGCDDQINRYNAQVGRGLEKVSVNRVELDVVRITHTGTWSAHCWGDDWQGAVRKEYLYSPKLGMFASMSFKLWTVPGGLGLVIDDRWDLISFDTKEHGRVENATEIALSRQSF